MTETRGLAGDDESQGRIVIPRRSCDQCRSRKIRCARGSPCSNCQNTGIACTHSSVAGGKTGPPKQRVLLSSQYERKIDEIAKRLDEIRVLLKSNDKTTNQPIQDTRLQHKVSPSSFKTAQRREGWDHAPQVVDFVKAVIRDARGRGTCAKGDEVLASLTDLIRKANNPTEEASSHDIEKVSDDADCSALPPSDAAASVLRWAKEHSDYDRIVCVSSIYPLAKFQALCQKIYFAVDEYSDTELLLVNGYLWYLFTEHVLATGDDTFRQYSTPCRDAFHGGLQQLPLFLCQSMETVATLTLGAFHCIGESKNSMAWSLISSASNIAQTLQYHREPLNVVRDTTESQSQQSLFWATYRIEKGLSLRLGRSSTICDSDITIAFPVDESQVVRIANIQGRVYEKLFSPHALLRSDADRETAAKALAEEIRGVMEATHNTMMGITSSYNNKPDFDAMRIVYLHCNLVCESSLLTMILRAVPGKSHSEHGISQECIEAARNTMEIHHQCMASIQSGASHTSFMKKYLAWAIVHVPFVPFSILFTHAVRYNDYSDFARLESFVASLEPDAASDESTTHPYKLYALLCQTARHFIESSTQPSSTGTTNDTGEILIEVGSLGSDLTSDAEMLGFSEWFYGNQQFMSFLDDTTSW